jgi:hypothetical protein
MPNKNRPTPPAKPPIHAYEFIWNIFARGVSGRDALCFVKKALCVRQSTLSERAMR